MDKRSFSVSPQKASPKRIKVSVTPTKQNLTDTAHLLDELCLNEDDYNFLISSVS